MMCIFTSETIILYNTLNQLPIAVKDTSDIPVQSAD